MAIPDETRSDEQPQTRDWVIEQFESRPIAVDIRTARVDINGRWAYTITAWDRANGHYPNAKVSLSELKPIRAGQRFDMDTAIARLTKLKGAIPHRTYRARNVVTGDFIMADIL